MQKWLHDNEILMYLSHNKGKSVVSGRFLRTLKIRIYKKRQLIIKNIIFSYLNELLDKYNHTYHNSFVKRPVDGDYSILTRVINLKLNLNLKLKLVI